MRIQAEHGDFRLRDTEVTFQGSVHQPQLGEDLLGGDAGHYILKRNVACNDSNLQLAADHEHSHVAYSECLLEVLSVAGEAEARIGHRPLVYRSCDKHVDITVLEVLYSLVESCDGAFCRFRRWLARLHIDIVRKAVENVDLLGLGL